MLDYLSRGYVKSNMSKFGGKTIAQAIGTEQFTLLELAPKNGVDLEIQDHVYIGKGKREKIYRVLGKLDYENLTATSRIELDYAIRDIVDANEEKFVLRSLHAPEAVSFNEFVTECDKNVISVTVNGKSASFTQNGSAVKVNCDLEFNAENTNIIVISF